MESMKSIKPYVICHMCTSVDGKIIGDRWGKLRAYKHESDLFEIDRMRYERIKACSVKVFASKHGAGAKIGDLECRGIDRRRSLGLALITKASSCGSKPGAH